MEFINKKDLGVNGEHTKLGREFNMAEFKGFTIAKVDSIEKMLGEIKEDSKEYRKLNRERFEDNEKDIKELKTFKTQILTLATAVGIAGGVIGNGIINFLKLVYEGGM